MLKLKLPYFGHLMQRTDSLDKTLMLGRLKVGGEGDNRGWEGWMTSPTQWTWVWVSARSWWWPGGLTCCSPWGRKELDTTELLNWTELWHKSSINTVSVIPVAWNLLILSLCPGTGHLTQDRVQFYICCMYAKNFKVC